MDFCVAKDSCSSRKTKEETNVGFLQLFFRASSYNRLSTETKALKKGREEKIM